MSLRIADLDGTFELEVPLDGPALESLRLQIARLQSRQILQPSVLDTLGSKLSLAILEIVDPDLRPPTQAQVDYAVAIARELNVNLPGEALMFRCAMSDFLDRYVDLFKSRRRHATGVSSEA
jgi:hypothetical protein